MLGADVLVTLLVAVVLLFAITAVQGWRIVGIQRELEVQDEKMRRGMSRFSEEVRNVEHHLNKLRFPDRYGVRADRSTSEGEKVKSQK